MSKNTRADVDIQVANELIRRALMSCGANGDIAQSVAASCIDAQREGSDGGGLGGAIDYCNALRAGRVQGSLPHRSERPALALFAVDAAEGFTHPAFDAEFEALCDTTREVGVAVFGLRNGYASGSLGYYVRRLADRGFVALAATNAGPALVAASGAKEPVFCTNPIALGVPRDNTYPLVIDQSSSQTAMVNLRIAADNGHDIPDNWALDTNGQPTTDPAAALNGVLLAFGGARGANVALLVEMLAAGATAANWSLEAPSYIEGEQSPGTGLLVIAIHAALLAGPQMARRIDDYLNQLRERYGAYIPGERRAANRDRQTDSLSVNTAMLTALRNLAGAD